MSGPRQLRIRVHGRVQGVYYRASCRDEAQRLGLTGWVRNEPDGSVSVLAEGDETALQSLLQWCKQGPPSARVDRVDETWDEPGGEYSTFDVRR